MAARTSGAEEIGWFVEGLAVHVSGQLEQGHLAAPRQAVELGVAPERLRDAWSGRYRYGIRGSLVGYLDRTLGREAVRRLLAGTTQGEILAIAGRTESELRAGWRRFVLAAPDGAKGRGRRSSRRLTAGPAVPIIRADRSSFRASALAEEPAMSNSRRLASRFAVLVLVAAAAAPLAAGDKKDQKEYGEPRPDQALLYLIREGHFQGSGRTMFVFADREFLCTLDNNSYCFAYAPPGKQLLWLNWAKINQEVELEAGKTYYFNIWTGFDELDEASGKAFVAGVESFVTPEPKEIEKAAEHVRERYGKAQKTAAAKPEKETQATSLARRERHVAQWPKVDLTPYPVLCIESFVMADPKAGDRKKEYLVETAPKRMEDLVVTDLGDTVFERVEQSEACAPTEGTLRMRARITEYKPGSETARFMIAGAGRAKLEAIVELDDAASGSRLARFEPKGLWAWGGALGAASGIAAIEKNVAYEIASYLRKSRGLALSDPEP